MSKPVSLATCIAKMYEGAKLDNSGSASGTPKKINSTLLGSLGHIEEKINLLEGRVEQITNTQSIMLQKLESVCKGMGALENNFVQLRQDSAAGHSSVKVPLGERGVNDSAVIAEVRSLCGETVALLMSLKQEGQLQRKKIEGIEGSVSTLGKVLGYVGEAFRSSKIVEFILNGVVPWRKQGLLETTEDEKNTSDGEATKAKSSLCHTGTQAPEEINEQPADPHKNQEQKVKSPAPGSSPVITAEVPVLKSQRRPKEVTLKSREPGRVQAFAPDSPSDSEVAEASAEDKVWPTESVSITAASQHKSKTSEKLTEQTDSPAAAAPPSVPPSSDTLIKRDETNQQRECDGKAKDIPEAKLCHTAKPNLPIMEKLEQKETPKLREAEHEPKPRLPTQETNTKSSTHQNKPDSATHQNKPDSTTHQNKPDSTTHQNKPDSTTIQHKPDSTTHQNKPDSTTHQNKPDSTTLKNKPEPTSLQNKPEPSKHVKAASSSPKSEDQAKSTSLELQFPIIDDCPPCPAPFEHRIVSAKQVPLGSCYAVEPNSLLGGGRFGQVHKCAELSSGITLAAKIIKVKGMKEREEVKNEIGMMNQLNHVNLIQLYDAFESRTNLTLIMEYVEGGELFERIVNEQHQLTELDAIVFMRQICEGVQYLHQQYILHLDLKPENILCVSSTSNQIKIIDFGLARKYRPREKLKVNFGTPEFLAPEVVNYDFVSFPTDMWSVGVITYMLLSGLSPFLGDNDAETMNNILHANWDFDAEAFENVSEEAKDFISKLLIPAKCSRLSASGCMKHSWLNNLEEKAKRHRVRLKSQMRLQRYLAAHRQWKKHFYAVTAANRLKRFQQSRSISSTL